MIPTPQGKPGRADPPARRIAIIGGGLSGTLFALHMLRDHPRVPVCLDLIEPRETLGAGLAYDTANPLLRINVSAARMALFEEDRTHFDQWLRARGLPEDPEAARPDGTLFPRRGLFGAYVAELLARHAAGASGSRVRHVRDMARSVVAAPQPAFAVSLAGGETVTADMVVLATSHPPPALPAPLRHLPPQATARLLGNPWDSRALAAIPATARVVVLGTGLTGCDVIALLRGQGHAGPIVGLSRHGLLPRARTTLPVEAFGDFTTAPATDALSLLRRVRGLMAECAAGGRPWEDVIDAMRKQAFVLWNALPPHERRRALRHLRAFWDVHRFQCAPQIDDALRAAQAAGQLEIVAATLLGVETAPDGSLALELHPRHADAIARRRLRADFVVNCTGPAHGGVLRSNPLLGGMAAAGMLTADATGLGLAVDARAHLLRPDGSAWPRLFVVGPLARGTFGELMGLPQISMQPRALAAHVAEMLAA
ncbi:FAD/NAD(P)-binding protein [Lichenicoccus sp.]|uniref:FAD/NAD(P)-binding protein n=1 Tax=Lichenicoccus sp. TaxID=2781899 RepID=UPI003D1306FD